MNFEWDENKNLSNVKKHGLDFDEASTVFFDPFSIDYDDPDHSMLDEDRFLLFGITSYHKYVIVSYTMRGDSVRIISAREMLKREREKFLSKIKGA